MISKHVMRELLEQAINMHAERFERYGMSSGPLQFNLVNMIELNLGRQAGHSTLVQELLDEDQDVVLFYTTRLPYPHNPNRTNVVNLSSNSSKNWLRGRRAPSLIVIDRQSFRGDIRQALFDFLYAAHWNQYVPIVVLG